jgi:hypothetical protein
VREVDVCERAHVLVQKEAQEEKRKKEGRKMEKECGMCSSVRARGEKEK